MNAYLVDIEILNDFVRTCTLLLYILLLSWVKVFYFYFYFYFFVPLWVSMRKYR
jgi:hypothetical protein